MEIPKSSFKDELFVAILRQTDRGAVPVVAKPHGVSEQTIFTWKKRVGSFDREYPSAEGRLS